jgi:hypothetical protein
MSEDVVRIAERTWRRLGVPEGTRAELRDELRADLADAAADGRPAMDYVGGDPAGLARAWAAGRGVVRARPRLGRTALAAVLAMVPGASFGLLLVIGPSSMFLNELLLDGDSMANVLPGSSLSFTYAIDPPGWLVPLWYLVAAAFAYGGALAAVSAVLQAAGDVARLATVRALAWTLPVASVPATLSGVAVAGSGGYGYSGGLLLRVCLTVLAVVAAAVVATRLAVLRRAGTPVVPEPAPAG